MTGAASPAGLRLRIGRALVTATDEAAVTAAVQDANQRAAIPGLDASLTPGVVDPAKLRALLTALQSGDTAAPLKGRSLLLDAPALGVSTASPTHPEGFTAPLKITVLSEHADSVQAAASPAVDCALAATQATAARTQIAAAAQEAASLQSRASKGDTAARAALTPAQRRHQALAGAWLINADASLSCHPGDAAARADRDAAAAAVKAASGPSGRMG